MANTQAPKQLKPVDATTASTGLAEKPQTVQLVVGVPEKSDGGMGALEFTAAAIGALAWPVAAVVIAAIFHKQVADLIAKIRKLAWGDASVDFADQLDKAERRAEAVEPPPNAEETAEEPGVPDEMFKELVAISPNAAILDNWRKVESALEQLASEYKIDLTMKNRSSAAIIDLLRDRRLVNLQTVVVLEELRKLRNAAAHNDEITATDAFRFKELADRVLRMLVAAI